MSGHNGILDDLIDHVNLLHEMGSRFVEMDPALLRALEPNPAVAQPTTTDPGYQPSAHQRARTSASARSQTSSGAAAPTHAAAMADIAARISVCKSCPLHQNRTQTVPGQGNINSPDIMFIGEAPGAEEDQQGEPFVGAAGQFLTKMIAAMGYSRDEVFIANICKCRPPDNRTPHSDEIQRCLPFLQEQIRAVHPKTLFLLGNTAIKGLLGGTAARGQWARFDGIPVMSTYHPSYIIRFERGGDESSMKRAKKEVWYACKLVLAQLGRPVTASSRPAGQN